MNIAQQLPETATIHDMRKALAPAGGYESCAEYENANAWAGFDVNQRLALIRLAGFESWNQFGLKGQDVIQTLSKARWLDIPHNSRSRIIAGSRRARTIAGLRS